MILGNEETLKRRRTIWRKIVIDAKARGCFYNASKDDGLARVMTDALVGGKSLSRQFAAMSVSNEERPPYRSTRWDTNIQGPYCCMLSLSLCFLIVKDVVSCAEIIPALGKALHLLHPKMAEVRLTRAGGMVSLVKLVLYNFL